MPYMYSHNEAMKYFANDHQMHFFFPRKTRKAYSAIYASHQTDTDLKPKFMTYMWKCFPDPSRTPNFVKLNSAGRTVITYQSVWASSITRRIFGFWATGGVGLAEWSISPAAACVVCFMALEIELKMLVPVEEECEGWGGCRCFLSVAGETGELVELSGRCKSIM